MGRYFQIIDGEGFTMPLGKKWKLSCCDCGLVHDIVIVYDEDEKETIGIAMRRNKRATTMKRKRNKFIKS